MIFQCVSNVPNVNSIQMNARAIHSAPNVCDFSSHLNYIDANEIGRAYGSSNANIELTQLKTEIFT